MKQKAIELSNELGITIEHPDYPELDWQEAVSKGETREGYWDWVILAMEFDKHGWIEV